MEYPITEFPTKEQIADNKVIAAFMELTIITDGISWFDTDYKPLKKYHSDWNDLMPVWKKCKEIGLFMMTNGGKLQFLAFALSGYFRKYAYWRCANFGKIAMWNRSIEFTMPRLKNVA